jgi:PhoH-like ATPase
MSRPRPPGSVVLDTNVLLDDPLALTRYAAGEGVVYVPVYVLEELDAFKGESSERGQRARAVTRSLDQLRARGDLSKGVPLPDGGWLRLVSVHSSLHEEDAAGGPYDSSLGEGSLDGDVFLEGSGGSLEVPGTHYVHDIYGENPSLRADTLIMRCASRLKATLITRDTNLRVRAAAYGLNAEEALGPEGSGDTDPIGVPAQISVTDQLAAIGGALNATPAWGLTPLNDEQRLALHHLRDPAISLVTLTGKAGTGKTLLALAAGLAQVQGLGGAEEARYERVLVSRAIFPLGRDIGYLPGTMEEKMAPWLQPIYDNLDFLLRARPSRQPHRGRPRADELLDLGAVEVTPITYIRGRSIPRQYMIIDEAQNLTSHEVKTLLTRAGQGTKVVFIGDPHQVDNPYLDAHHNGLTYVTERFRGQACAAHVALLKGERSPLAELAADLL